MVNLLISHTNGKVEMTHSWFPRRTTTSKSFSFTLHTSFFPRFNLQVLLSRPKKSFGPFLPPSTSFLPSPSRDVSRRSHSIDVGRPSGFPTRPPTPVPLRRGESWFADLCEGGRHPLVLPGESYVCVGSFRLGVGGDPLRQPMPLGSPFVLGTPAPTKRQTVWRK